MKNLMLALLMAGPFSAMAQFGLQAGLNFTNVSSASSISNSSSSGFNAAVFFATSNKKILGSKTELGFSRQGYNYSTGTTSGKVNLDYIVLPQYMCINITHYFQIQFGFQFAYLVNAKTDSSKSSNPLGGTQYGQLVDYYNRFSYGLGGGIELHPVMGLLVGARINFSLNNLYKTPDPNSTATPSFVPEVNVKSNLFQFYAGWRFGK